LDTIVLGHPKHKKMFDEQDWAIIDSSKNPVNLHVKSKFFAEKEAWSINFENQNKMEFVVLNPGLIFGTR
jgi:nucleoside-diphosphate-sugar epimerase